jgi:glutaryl-CoA dehydrogenase
MATSGQHRAEQETVAGARELLGGKGIRLDHDVGRFVADAKTVWLWWLSRSIERLVRIWRQ